MARSPLEEHAPDVTREIMGRLSPEAMRTLRAVSEMRNRPAEDVLREELRGYIADKLPLPDVEAIIHAMGERFYALGYACGTAKRFLRKLRANDPQSFNEMTARNLAVPGRCIFQGIQSPDFKSFFLRPSSMALSPSQMASTAL